MTPYCTVKATTVLRFAISFKSRCKETRTNLCAGFFGTPEGIRTPDLLVRSQSLYPAELQAHAALTPPHAAFSRCKMNHTTSQVKMQPFFHLFVRKGHVPCPAPGGQGMYGEKRGRPAGRRGEARCGVPARRGAGLGKNRKS